MKKEKRGEGKERHGKEVEWKGTKKGQKEN